MIDLTNIAVCLTALIVAVVTAFFLPWLRAHTSEQELAQLLKWVEIAVAAAQQLYHSYDGEKRLQHALGVLADKGFDINDKTVRSAVEAEVLKLHQKLENAHG